MQPSFVRRNLFSHNLTKLDYRHPEENCAKEARRKPMETEGELRRCEAGPSEEERRRIMGPSEEDRMREEEAEEEGVG